MGIGPRLIWSNIRYEKKHGILPQVNRPKGRDYDLGRPSINHLEATFDAYLLFWIGE
jgi:hypothetical protein